MGLTPGGRLASLTLAAVPISNLSAGAPTWRRVYAMHSMLVRSLFFPGYLQCLLSSPALDGGADPRKKFIGKNSKTP